MNWRDQRPRSKAPRAEDPRAPVPRARLAGGLFLWALAVPTAAQFGTIRHEQKLSSISGGLGPVNNDYRFGVSVAELDDFDGDGTRDIAVGAHRANIGGAERGAVYILLLNPDGTVKSRREISSLSGGFLGPL